MQCFNTEFEACIKQVIKMLHFLLMCNDNRHGILDIYYLFVQYTGLHAHQFQ
jgi:hypothetical protein